MKVIRIENVIETEREVHCPKGGFVSYRYLLKKDGMGFSLHRTDVPRGERQHWHYKNHLEACYCMSGVGELTDIESNETFLIKPGDCYVLDKNDNHYFRAKTDVVLISVFNPPVAGREVHNEDGSYE